MPRCGSPVIMARSHDRCGRAVTGRTGSHTGAHGKFSFTSPSPGVLGMTLTLLP